MTELSKKYGDIYRLQLGTVKTVVVSSMRLIRKVLIEQGADFGDRANFMRYNILFSNDRGNCKCFRFFISYKQNIAYISYSIGFFVLF